MTFRKKIISLKKNASTLLEFMGYDTNFGYGEALAEFKNDGGFSTNTEALKYARQEYNAEVLVFNTAERNSRIINPLTNRMIKKYTLLNLNGSIRDKYIGRLIIENGVLIKNTSIIGIDTNTNEIAKFNINEADTPFLQQTFGFDIPQNQIIQNNIVNNIAFTHNIPRDKEVMLTLRIKFRVKFSEFFEDKMVIKTRLFTGRQISSPEFINGLILEDAVWASGAELQVISTDIMTTLNNAKMTLDNMILREAEPLNIDNLYNEIVNEKRIENCIHDYMFKIYKTHSKSENQKNKIRQLHTTDDIYQWCKKYNIKMIAYDINGNVIKANYPPKKNKLRNMIYIAFNNHLYPLKNTYLNKTKIDKYTVSVIDNCNDKLLEILKTGTLPTDIKINREGVISSFIVTTEKSICYTENTEYYKCLEILEIFGIKDKMTVGTKLSHLGNIIEELYRHGENSKSFFPFGSDFNKGGYNYNNEDLQLQENEVFQTIDKNKSYSYELSQLPYLITCDIKYHKSKKINELINPHKITPHYLYTIEIDCPTLHLPNNDYFEGNTLIKARDEGINFRILEEQETETKPNYFKEMVRDLYDKVSNDTFKEIMNIHIGKFEMSNMTHNYIEFDKLLGCDELDTFEGHVFSLNDEYSIGCKQSESINIFNKKPISVQVKDRSRLRLFNMMKTLGLKNSDIKQVKTDSITFKKLTDNYTDYIHDNLTGWKIEEYSAIKKPIIMRRKPLTFEYKSYAGNEYDNIKKSGTIGLGDAGNGKTYKIITEIIPKLDKDYIVLTPSHATIKEYRAKKLNCSVIQTYTFSNDIPEAHNIIVDEIGMVGVSAWDMLVKCKIAGKNIMVFGDNGQLAPVQSNLCDNPNFYNLMFEEKLKLDKNYRNNFSKKYYDYLKTTTKRKAEVIKHNTPYDKAHVIIAYTHNTRIKYNKKMCEKLGINSMCDSGTKIICKTNDLGKKHNIFNNFCYEVVNCVDETVTITDGHEEYEIEIKDIIKHFDYAYARTLHSVQGQTLKSFHYCIEDIDYLDGRGLYTLISRLKQ